MRGHKNENKRFRHQRRNFELASRKRGLKTIINSPKSLLVEKFFQDGLSACASTKSPSDTQIVAGTSQTKELGKGNRRYI